MKKLKCLKCSYEWFKIKPDLPKVCPRCKSYAWNGPFKKALPVNLLLVLATLAAFSACTKHRENGSPVTATVTSPVPINPCQGFTTTSSLTGKILINANLHQTLVGFDLGCGDSVRVFMRRSGDVPPQAWTEYFTNTPVNYYVLTGTQITLHNGASVDQDYDIEAILK